MRVSSSETKMSQISNNVWFNACSFFFFKQPYLMQSLPGLLLTVIRRRIFDLTISWPVLLFMFSLFPSLEPNSWHLLAQMESSMIRYFGSYETGWKRDVERLFMWLEWAQVRDI